MGVVMKIADQMIFFVMLFFSGLAGLSYVWVKGLFRGKRSFIENGAPVNRLTFCIMNLEKARYMSDLKEDLLLNDTISRQVAVFFDFESKKDSHARITDNIMYYHFSVHKEEKLAKMGFAKISALVNFVRNVLFLINVCRKQEINCVESYEAVFLGFTGLIFSRILGAPFVLHLNTSYEVKYRASGKVSVKFLRFRRLEKWIEYLTARLADVITADRNFYKDLKDFPKKCIEKYVTTGLRVNEKYYAELDTRRNLKKSLNIIGRDVILYVGRLHPVKYVSDLVTAFKRIRKENAVAFLLIVGEGGLEGELKNMVQEYDLTEDVLFLGAKTPDELKDIFFTADVVVQPHGGVVLLEAALAGTPCVVYDFDWHKEFLQDGKTGFIVPFRDTEKLAEKTLNLLSDKKLNARMGLYSRMTALSGYSRARSIRKEKTIYDKLLRKDF